MIHASLFEFSPGRTFFRILGTYDIHPLILIIPTDIERGKFVDIADPYRGNLQTITLNRSDLFSTREDAVTQACKNLEHEIEILKQSIKK